MKDVDPVADSPQPRGGTGRSASRARGIKTLLLLPAAYLVILLLMMLFEEKLIFF